MNRILSQTFPALFVALLAFTGCERKAPPAPPAEQSTAAPATAPPGIEETKTIAEEGFIYGLPLVMCSTDASAIEANAELLAANAVDFAPLIPLGLALVVGESLK